VRPLVHILGGVGLSACGKWIRIRGTNAGNCELAILGGAMEREQIAELRARLDEIDRLLAQLSAELKGIRETLHAAAPAAGSQDGDNRAVR
jgi:hypothetical protein